MRVNRFCEVAYLNGGLKRKTKAEHGVSEGAPQSPRTKRPPPRRASQQASAALSVNPIRDEHPTTAANEENAFGHVKHDECLAIRC